MLRLSVPSVSFLRWVVLVVGLSAGGLLHAQVDPADVLQGGWKMIDESPALIHHENNEDFAVVRVIPGESDWADGSFFLKWPNAVRPERGYYSIKNGRVWITTYRWVNQKRERVEYTGVLKVSREGVIWEGTCATTASGARTIWPFTAEKTGK